MHDQPRYEPLEASEFFADGASARPLPAGTVARGRLRADPRPPPASPTTAASWRRRPSRSPAGAPARPRALRHLLLALPRPHRQRPRHDRAARLHAADLVPRAAARGAPAGYFFNVMTEGYGVMPSYAAQVPVADRWAIAAYIRALQLAQEARLADLPPAQRRAAELELAARPAAPPGRPPRSAPGSATPATPLRRRSTGSSAAPSLPAAPGSCSAPSASSSTGRTSSAPTWWAGPTGWGSRWGAWRS